MVSAIDERHRIQKLVGPRPRRSCTFSGNAKGQGDVISRVQLIEQIVVLEDKTDRQIPQPGPRLGVESSDIAAIERDTAVIGPIEQTDQVEQGALADPRRADYRQHRALGDLEIEVFQNLDPGAAGAKALAHRTKIHQMVMVIQNGDPPPARAARSTATAAMKRRSRKPAPLPSPS